MTKLNNNSRKIKKTRKKSNSISSKSKRYTILEKIKLSDKSDLKNFKIKKQGMIVPKTWELTNRKTFYNWLHDNYGDYDSSTYQYKPTDNYFRIQKLVRDFMQDTSPYRGILLYHGLGSGKTCSAIAITEAIRNKKEVIIISKAALERNFRDNIMKCGFDYMKKDNYWVFIKGNTQFEKELINELNIPNSIINENGGCFIIDYSVKKSNFEEMSKTNQKKLINQIEGMINNRFKFLHLDDTRLLKKVDSGDFDNKVIVVDEVHNLTNTMSSGTTTGIAFYDLLMGAKDCKIVFLSGTPIINSLFEVSKLYNILRGIITTFSFRLVPEFGRNIQYGLIKAELIKNKYVDQIIVDKIRKTVKITMNPKNFINHLNGKGLVYSEKDKISLDEFKVMIDKTMSDLKSKCGYSKANLTIEENTCMPEDPKEFQKMFYNTDTNKIKKPDVLKKRIVGLTSYYEKVDKDNFPTLRSISQVQVPMSDYQLSKYQKFRIAEIEKDKQMRRRKNEEELKSSYRIYSRLHCTFVFPEEIGSPYESKNLELIAGLEDLKDNEQLDDDKLNMTKKQITDKTKKLEQISKEFLVELDKRKDEFMSLENGSLDIYSPKYSRIIERVLQSEGCCFVYSQFIEKVGLKTFAIGLNATGKFAPFQIKKEGDQYVLDIKKQDMNKMKYIFYAGDTKEELREIYRLIYNSEFERLPPSCSNLKKQLLKMYGEDENLHGNIIKLFLTTRSGAEGVDLKHIRQIHIMEPYWQPVLIKQIIGRGVRYKSHTRLPANERFVDVFIYMSVITDKQLKSVASATLRQDYAKYNVDTYKKMGKTITSDEYLYITAERKRELINQTQKLIKESSFDCTLNYKDNIKDNDENRGLLCLNYDKDNRTDESNYLFAPGLEDTIDIVDIQQEELVNIIYEKIELPKGSGKMYYRLQKPQPGQPFYLYAGDKNPAEMARTPKPIGEIKVVNGKKKVLFFKKKSKRSSKK